MIPKTVDTSVVCVWLGIPPDQWPPDHYTLLGLSPGEQDVGRIERQVQQRLELVRRYQLTNPEPATEAMNRIAQAFVCLTDPQARRAYDLALFGSGGVPTPSPSTAATQQTAIATEADPEFLALVEEEIQATPAVATTPLKPETPGKVEQKGETGEERERDATARRGLGTRRAIFERIVRTRALLRLWERLGRFMGQAKKRLSRPSEARELIEVLTNIREHVRDFPPLLGEAGQPGYLVVALAKQPALVPTFQTLLPSQREALARDWNAGKKTLEEHQVFLRQESRSLRRKSLLGKGVRAVRAFINEHPGGWLILLGLLALAITLVRRTFLT